MNPRPRVALVGGPDVDARVPLMRELGARFEFTAYGSDPRAGPKIADAGFAFRHYPLSRRVAPWTDVRSFWQLRAAFLQTRPDVVHAFDTKPGVFGCLAARSAGVPVVLATITGLGALYAQHDLRTRGLRKAYEMLQRLACDRADITIFQNHDDERQLVAAGVATAGKTAVILGSGVDTRRFAPRGADASARARVRAELGIPLDAVTATMIARVTRSKGVLEFMAAARTVRAATPNARFLLIGPDDRESRDRLSQVELEELRRLVVWPGSRDDVPDLLAASDLFVLPTAYREGIPRVLLEAAASGLPLVTTDSPGCNEACVHGHNGMLVRIGDADALAAAIAALATDASLRQRFAAASRARAETMFDLGVISGQMAAAWERLLSQKVGNQATRAGSSST